MSETPEAEQAVLVYLDGAGWSDTVYQEHAAELEDRLIEIIEQNGLGEFDGIERGRSDTKLFMYGPDAERLFAGIEQTLLASPICPGARVVIRHGEPGAEEREVRLHSSAKLSRDPKAPILE